MDLLRDHSIPVVQMRLAHRDDPSDHGKAVPTPEGASLETVAFDWRGE
ncbi:MAG: hypothetical protein RL885_13020 [Planctomycetota bacterium]